MQNGHNVHQLEPVDESEVTGVVQLNERKQILAVGWSRKIVQYSDSDADVSVFFPGDAWTIVTVSLRRCTDGGEGRSDVRTNGRMDGRKVGRRDRRMDGRMNEQRQTGGRKTRGMKRLTGIQAKHTNRRNGIRANDWKSRHLEEQIIIISIKKHTV